MEASTLSVHMMHFRDVRGVRRVGLQKLCQLAVERKQNIHAQREIAAPDEAYVLEASVLGLLTDETLGIPTGAAAYYAHTSAPCVQHVLTGCLRGCELDCNIRIGEGRTIEVVAVVYVDTGYDLMTPLQGDLLDHVPHAPVTY